MQRGTKNSLLAIDIGAGLRGGGGPPAAAAQSSWLNGIKQRDELGVGRGRRAARGVFVVPPNSPLSTPTDIGSSGQPAPVAQRPGRGRCGGGGADPRAAGLHRRRWSRSTPERRGLPPRGPNAEVRAFIDAVRII